MVVGTAGPHDRHLIFDNLICAEVGGRGCANNPSPAVYPSPLQERDKTMISLSLRGVVVYRGASMLDGQPIVMIATFKTANAKTGNMVQTWIMPAGISPVAAINTGADYSVCGNCSFRGRIVDGRNVGRACYVQVRNAPRAVWQACQNGSYPDYSPTKHGWLFSGRKLRMGSYGDPLAVPYSVWQPLVELSAGHTGYTHSWRIGKLWRFRRWLMASVENENDMHHAQRRGWRTFRTLPTVDDISNQEILCPASDEAGKLRTCETCRACHGNPTQQRAKRSVAIVAHGGLATMSNYRKLVSIE